MVVRRLAVLAHYDAQGEVKPYVRYYLERLRECCERLILVSTAALSPETRAEVAPLVDDLELRDNVGFDFAMWRWAIEANGVGEYDEVLLTNSSVFGPLGPLQQVFDRMADDPCDFWGMTENFEIAWHIQSYFLVFRRAVVQSPAFRQFWAGVLPYRDKFQVIRSYEVGLSAFLTDVGLRGRAVVPSADLFPRWPLNELFRYKWRNPTCYHPERLLDHGVPFVKVELLRDNPIRVPLEPVRERMLRAGYPVELIQFDPRGDYFGKKLDDPFFRWLQRPLGRLVDRVAAVRDQSWRA